MTEQNLSKNYKENSTSLLFKAGVILTALVLPHIALKLLGIEIDINPFVLTGILFTGFVLFFFLVKKSIKNPIIPYILLQLIVIWIFFGQKILSPVGLNFKPHAVVFLLAVLTSGYFLFAKFKELWEYKPFKYIFGFFLISAVYAFFYKTDFRSSSYIDLWIQNNMGLRFNALQSGTQVVSRDFGSGETKFLVYLVGLAPLVGFLSGFNSFWEASLNPQALKNSLYKLISFMSGGIFAYYIFLAISLVIGASSVMFVDNRLFIDGGFAGGYFEAIFLMVMIAFYSLLNINCRNFKFYNAVKAIIIFNITVLSFLILLGIKKGTIISLGIALLVSFAIIFAVKRLTGKSFTGNIIPQKNKPALAYNTLNPLMLLVPVLLLALAFLVGTGSLENFITNISERFSSNDTLEIRMINWNMYISHWWNSLDLHKILFGFGIDSSRELTFFLTAMHPVGTYHQPHIHNVYLEMFYNYGLMAIFFFLPFIYILKANLKDAFNGASEFGVKIVNVLSIGVIVLSSIFYMSESPSMIAIIIIFALLGFLESIRNVIGHKSKILV